LDCILLLIISLNLNGKFKLTKQKNIEKATNAMYEVIRRGKRHNLSFSLFANLEPPIQNYP
jgi:hypothetical protein